MKYKDLIKTLNGFAMDWRQSETEVDKIRVDGLAYECIEDTKITDALVPPADLKSYYDVTKRLKRELR